MSDSYIALVEKSIDERTQQYQELLQLREENEKLRVENEQLRGLLREAHVKMDENNLWVNLRRRIAKVLFDL